MTRYASGGRLPLGDPDHPTGQPRPTVLHEGPFLCHTPDSRARGAAKVPPRIDWENVAEAMYRTAIEERRVTADRAAFARAGRRRARGRT